MKNINLYIQKPIIFKTAVKFLRVHIIHSVYRVAVKMLFFGSVIITPFLIDLCYLYIYIYTFVTIGLLDNRLNYGLGCLKKFFKLIMMSCWRYQW